MIANHKTPEAVDVASASPAADEQSSYAFCLQSAYEIARSALVHGVAPGIEASVLEGVVYGGFCLSGEQKKHLASEVMARLFGRSIDELADESKQELEIAQTRLEILIKEFEHDQA